MIYDAGEYVYGFRRLRTIRVFDHSIFTGKITIIQPDKRQSNLLDVILHVDNKVRPRSNADK